MEVRGRWHRPWRQGHEPLFPWASWLFLQTSTYLSLLSVPWTSGRARRPSPTLCGSTRAVASPSPSTS